MTLNRSAWALALGALLSFPLSSAVSAPLRAAEAPPAPKPTFLVVGTFHFEGSASDLMSNRFPDALTPKRQKEIEDLVDALARFRPTKVAIEAGWGSTRAQEEFAAYRKGEYTLTASEVDQVAYRLAKKLGRSGSTRSTASSTCRSTRSSRRSARAASRPCWTVRWRWGRRRWARSRSSSTPRRSAPSSAT